MCDMLSEMKESFTTLLENREKGWVEQGAIAQGAALPKECLVLSATGLHMEHNSFWHKICSLWGYLVFHIVG